MKRKKEAVNCNDVLRRAVFTRQVLRRTRRKPQKIQPEPCNPAPGNPATGGHVSDHDSLFGGMAQQPYKYAHSYGLRSPRFLLLSYLHKMRGYDMAHEASGPMDIFWSCLGSFAGIFILMLLDRLIFTGDQLLLLGSFGASSVIIFGAPHSIFAQPRSVVGGQVISAFVGVTVFLLLGHYPLLAAPLAVSLAFAAMQLTKTMHPPGGATALIAVSGHSVVQQMGYGYTLLPVGAGIVILLVIGIVVNNISRNRLYPLRWW